MTYIRLKTKEQFKETVGDKWKKETWLWDTFREETCYIPLENCFISLDRAIKLGYLEQL